MWDHRRQATSVTRREPNGLYASLILIYSYLSFGDLRGQSVSQSCKSVSVHSPPEDQTGVRLVSGSAPSRRRSANGGRQ